MVDGVHRFAQHVGEPQQALEPARAFAEAEAGGQWGQPVNGRRHRAHPILVSLSGVNLTGRPPG